MARKRFGPQHDITGEAVFIPYDDGAWDRARIDAEIAECRRGTIYEKRGKDVPLSRFEDDPAHQHPFMRYQFGKTRYDLEAEGIREYLDENKEPEKYRIKRLSWHTRDRCGRFIREDNAGQAWVLAFLDGVVGLENGDETLRKLLRDREAGKAAGDDALIEAATNVAYEVIEDVGSAVFRLSQDLSEEEKKITT